jgi:hypothetical protein
VKYECRAAALTRDATTAASSEKSLCSVEALLVGLGCPATVEARGPSGRVPPKAQLPSSLRVPDRSRVRNVVLPPGRSVSSPFGTDVATRSQRQRECERLDNERE